MASNCPTTPTECPKLRSLSASDERERNARDFRGSNALKSLLGANYTPAISSVDISAFATAGKATTFHLLPPSINETPKTEVTPMLPYSGNKDNSYLDGIDPRELHYRWNLTLTQTAELLGISLSTAKRYISPRRKNPPPPNAFLHCWLLNNIFEEAPATGLTNLLNLPNDSPQKVA